MLVPLNFTGGSYKHRTTDVSAQRTVNFRPQKQSDEKSFSDYILVSYPGYKSFATTVGADRGIFEHLDVLYKVSGTTLYSVSSSGVATSLGNIPGSGRCIFDGINSNVVISTEGLRYIYNGTNVTQIIDSDLESGDGVAHLNSKILFDGTGGRFCTSDVGDATSINSLNYATAESYADDLQRVYVFNQVAFMMGKKTIEPWYDSGQGNPPLERYEGAQINVGLGAIYSVANDDDAMYFLGDDRQVYILRGGASSAITVISTIPINEEFKTYSTVSDAIGHCINLDGQWEYQITFPTENKTWVYTVGGEWFEKSSGVFGDRDRANGYAYCYGKHLVSDYQDGAIYEIDVDTYTDAGNSVIRLRDSAPIHGGLLKAAGKMLTMNSLEINIERGVGLVSDPNDEPSIMVSFSDDGGKTFSTEQIVTIGALGNFTKTVRLDSLGSFYSRIIRIRTSDVAKFTILSGQAEIEVGI